LRLPTLLLEMALAREREPIRGPLGIWPFPVLNTLLELIARFRERRLARLAKLFPAERSSTPAATYQNIEEYSIWEEPSGVIRVRVKRKAERS